MGPPEFVQPQAADGQAGVPDTIVGPPGSAVGASLGGPAAGPGAGGGLSAPAPAPAEAGEGGLTSISPPSNVKVTLEDAPKILATGIDTLVVTMDLNWKDGEFFEKLDELKSEAKVEEKGQPGEVRYTDDSGGWVFNVASHGSRGYNWLLGSGEYAMSVGAWLEPISRPSLVAEVRSETLWSRGHFGAMTRLRHIVEGMGAKIVSEKASRADLCADVLLPAELFSMAIPEKHLVKRAAKVDPHFTHDVLSGLSIGAGGKISARFYDKPMEIVAKGGKKMWMYPIWGLESVPVGCRVIRVEFQLQRERLKQLAIDTPADLFRLRRELWAYCTQKWLRVVDDRTKHHTQQAALPWWKVVEGAYWGIGEAHPLVRSIAIAADEKALLQQFEGYLTSWLALMAQEATLADVETISLDWALAQAGRMLAERGTTGEKLAGEVRRKLAKYQRILEKSAEYACTRQSAGISSAGTS
ncbi:MAG: hypothetical protein BIFFINMI_04113 [Phycisphaerae bacterium]|nr:hypothetical protein [Phycisphaerae bacterium]